MAEIDFSKISVVSKEEFKNSTTKNVVILVENIERKFVFNVLKRSEILNLFTSGKNRAEIYEEIIPNLVTEPVFSKEEIELANSRMLKHIGDRIIGESLGVESVEHQSNEDIIRLARLDK